MSLVSRREVAKVLRKTFTTIEKVFLTKDRPFYTHQPTNVHQSQRRRAFSTAFRRVHDSSSYHKRGFWKKEPASEWSEDEGWKERKKSFFGRVDVPGMILQIMGVVLLSEVLRPFFL
jgi:hypothetical protein